MAEDEQNGTEGDERAPAWYRADMAKRATEMQSLRDELGQFRKAEVFNQVGIPPEGVGKLFRDTYSGDLTVDAIRAAAEQYQILAPPPPATPVEEQQAHSRIFDAAKSEGTVNVDNGMVDALNASSGGQDTLDALAKLGLLHERTM